MVETGVLEQPETEDVSATINKTDVLFHHSKSLQLFECLSFLIITRSVCFIILLLSLLL